jgi:hypothetical protein
MTRGTDNDVNTFLQLGDILAVNLRVGARINAWVPLTLVFSCHVESAVGAGLGWLRECGSLASCGLRLGNDIVSFDDWNDGVLLNRWWPFYSNELRADLREKAPISIDAAQQLSLEIHVSKAVNRSNAVRNIDLACSTHLRLDPAGSRTRSHMRRNPVILHCRQGNQFDFGRHDLVIIRPAFHIDVWGKL